MRMFDDPLFHFYIEPEAVDAEGYNGKQEPFDIVTKQLDAFVRGKHMSKKGLIDRRKRGSG